MNQPPRILIIGHDARMSSALEEAVRKKGLAPCSFFQAGGPLSELENVRPDLALLGSTLDSRGFQESFLKLKIIDPAIPILIPDETIRFSVGPGLIPFEMIYYINAQLQVDEISEAIDAALRCRAECEMLPEYPMIIGQSEAIKAIKQKIQNIADKDVTVLITGETGTGKELVARSIHWHSLRRKGSLVRISCGALPDELLESEVFGFQKGAFTGAHKDKPGRMEMAHGGTLFIDEIGDLSLSLQVKFLQIFEDSEFARLGGTEETPVDARIIAATNKDLWKKAREGTFRRDLFHRLNVVHVRTPSLRERKDDIPILTRYFLTKYCHVLKRESLDLPDGIARHLGGYHWPGNVRELENVIRRAVVLRNWEFVFKDLKIEERVPIGDDSSSLPGEMDNFAWGEDSIKEQMLENGFSLKKLTNAYVLEAESRMILQALEATEWNRKRAAQMLGVSYKTLLTRVAEYKLRPPL